MRMCRRSARIGGFRTKTVRTMRRPDHPSALPRDAETCASRRRKRGSRDPGRCEPRQPRPLARSTKM
jgi:hypothetical protein